MQNNKFSYNLVSRMIGNSKLYEEDQVFRNFYEQKHNLENYLRYLKKTKIRIGTLGPVGTTSYVSAEFFVDYIKKLNNTKEYEIKVWDSFDLVYQALSNDEADIVIIPNAYDKISEFLWNMNINNLFSYLKQTPFYGIASKQEESVKLENRIIKVACCKPVLYFIEMFGELKKAKSYEIIHTDSNYQAGEMVSSGKVNFAVTNELIVEKFGLKFISPTWKSDLLWSVFSKKAVLIKY